MAPTNVRGKARSSQVLHLAKGKDVSLHCDGQWAGLQLRVLGEEQTLFGASNRHRGFALSRSADNSVGERCKHRIRTCVH